MRYSATHEAGDERVYNLSDIDDSKTIWARDMDPAKNDELIRYYKDRDVWLVQPDVAQAMLGPYVPWQRLDPSLAAGQ